jgi:molybdate transport system ATP-binding protein
LKGVLFSDLAIKNLLKEYQYDSITDGLIRSRKFNTLSSGAKNGLLTIAWHKIPDYIVFDNPLDHLDQNTRLALIETLKKLATTLL